MFKNNLMIYFIFILLISTYLYSEERNIMNADSLFNKYEDFSIEFNKLKWKFNDTLTNNFIKKEISYGSLSNKTDLTFWGKNKKFILTLSSVLFGSISMYYKNMANKLYYDDYQRKINSEKINKYDIIAGTFLGLLQINVIYLGYLLIYE